MSLGSALATAMAGLRANQAALSIVSSNIANAQTPGYVTQSVNQIEIADRRHRGKRQGHRRNRQLNQFIQTQLRTETSGGAYADQIASVLTQLQASTGLPATPARSKPPTTNFTTRAAVAVGNFGQLVGADPGRDGGAIAGAATERHHAGHSNVAFQCRAGHRYFRQSGQCRNDPDRAISIRNCRD